MPAFSKQYQSFFNLTLWLNLSFHRLKCIFFNYHKTKVFIEKKENGHYTYSLDSIFHEITICYNTYTVIAQLYKCLIKFKSMKYTSSNLYR